MAKELTARNKDEAQVLDSLFQLIHSRKGAKPKTSYTAKLFGKGIAKIAAKLGEESVETVIAGIGESRARVVAESADLLYHLLVLWAARGVKPADVWAELRRREGVSGLQEKASRTKGRKKPKSKRG
ncbi:MAG: phosphoribosyl-ATP diphosphatase [Rhodospirillales bacterium]|nr:phosphoribosyl-ATP diphosphatase [Rhodospirillales bacterium]